MKGKSTFKPIEADKIINLIKQKVLAHSKTQKSLRRKIRNLGFYAKDDFGIAGGYTVTDFLRVATIDFSKSDEIFSAKTEKSNKRINSDELYILDICDKVLDLTSSRQHRFDFLKGDVGTKLPVDIYYPTLNLVIEYREKQHSEQVKFFDKKLTFSKLSRGEQRKKYDELRRVEIPKNGLNN